jgi:hypothetical protein
MDSISGVGGGDLPDAGGRIADPSGTPCTLRFNHFSTTAANFFGSIGLEI